MSAVEKYERGGGSPDECPLGGGHDWLEYLIDGKKFRVCRKCKKDPSGNHVARRLKRKPK